MNLKKDQVNEKSYINDNDYDFFLLSEPNIQVLYEWNLQEKHFEYYTCRPVNLSTSFEKYTFKIKKSISEGKQRIYVLTKKDDRNTPLGKITLFDFNPRNHSAEFGYYFPENNRAKGLGSVILSKFTKTIFDDDKLNLNKIYATTCSNNIPSIKLLENTGFKLDGRQREHYWINGNKYDQLIYSMLKCECTK